ncbi:cytidine deaminase-like protein [Scheffersomyces coipomensis]|uniref:cytidine deaminase-like protein n=1 Tax=Scheffersomyces coipomensis TaxID=1788519 RepID=UPI00315DD6EE
MMDLTTSFEDMAISLFIGYKALLISETPVACILKDKKSNKIISIGYNYTNSSLNGTQHAEFIAVKRLYEHSKDIDFSNIIMYVTVEPCIMCASFLRQLGIGEVIYGCSNDRFGGNGTVLSVHKDTFLVDKPYKSIGGIARTEAIQLLRNFYIQENESAPVPKIKKNKDIENKLYPPNLFNLTKEEFVDFYGEQRLDILENKEQEITPIPHKAYRLKDLISLKNLQEVPFLEDELGLIDEEQLNEFYDLFYDINDDSTIDFTKAIRKFNNKKRHLTPE